MHTLERIGRRFREAFARYSIADARLRRLRAELPEKCDSAGIHGINAQLGLVIAAEREYRAARLEYIERLLLPDVGTARM
jgi:hypothetical protein